MQLANETTAATISLDKSGGEAHSGLVNDETKTGKLNAVASEGPTRITSGRRQCLADGTPVPAYDWTSIVVTPEMQALADSIFANSAARRPMVGRH